MFFISWACAQRLSAVTVHLGLLRDTSVNLYFLELQFAVI